MPKLILGTSKDDVLKGTSGDDLIYGLAGHDTIDGGAGNDIISGGGRDLPMLAKTRFATGQDWAGSVTFMGESAGYKNVIGMYEIAADGSISNVTVLFANGSAKGSGGDLVPGTSAVASKFKAGASYGFFIVPNGYGTDGKTLDKPGTYILKTASGAPANVNTPGPLVLWHKDAAGVETKITGAYNGETFHSLGAPGEGVGLNSDGLDHARVSVDPATGTLTIAFEDLKGGGDKDFDDAVIRIDIGSENAMVLGDSDAAGNGGDDKLSGGLGDDTILGMAGNDTIWGGQGNDKLWGNTGNDTIYGDEGDDRAFGGEGNDTIYGGAGNDKLSGNTGADKISGDDGNDTISGNDGDDALYGGNGNDTIAGGKGADSLSGDAGDDKLNGDTGADKVFGGAGADTMMGGDGDDVLSGDAGNDTINGGKGVDKIADGDGNDKVDADSGDDTIIAGAGDDTYIGGVGIDTLDFSAFTGGGTINLFGKKAYVAGVDTLWGIENVIGSAGDDTIIGDTRDNAISGGNGNDIIQGGQGDDMLTGGAGNDTFLWQKWHVKMSSSLYVDTITDFSKGDVLDLRALPDLKAGQSVSGIVALRVEGGDTVLSAAFGAGGSFLDVAVLKGVTGLTVESLYADGALLV